MMKVHYKLFSQSQLILGQQTLFQQITSTGVCNICNGLSCIYICKVIFANDWFPVCIHWLDGIMENRQMTLLEIALLKELNIYGKHWFPVIVRFSIQLTCHFKWVLNYCEMAGWRRCGTGKMFGKNIIIAWYLCMHILYQNSRLGGLLQ